MTQEVKVMLQLTLDVNTKLSKDDITKDVERAIGGGFYDPFTKSALMTIDIIEVREEDEIYEND